MQDPAIDLIRERMARIRTRATGKAGRLSEETKQFLDWKHYIKLFPWESVAVAAVFGYVMVPRRSPLTRSDTGALAAQFAREQQTVIDAQQALASKASPSLFGSVVGLAGSTLWRLGMAYAGKELSNMLVGMLAPPADAPGTPDQEQPRPPRREQNYDDFVRRPA